MIKEGFPVFSKFNQTLRNISQNNKHPEKRCSNSWFSPFCLPTVMFFTVSCYRCSTLLEVLYFHLFKTCGYPPLLSFSSNISFLLRCFLKTPCQSFLPLFAPLSSAFTIAGTRKNLLTFFFNASNPVISMALLDRYSKFQFLLLKHPFKKWSLLFLTGPHKHLILRY